MPDALAHDSGQLLSIDIHSDGIFVWTEETAHYVEVYGARLPDDFISHVQRHEDVPTLADLPEDLTEEALTALQQI